VRGKDVERCQRELIVQNHQGKVSWIPIKITYDEFINQYMENIEGINQHAYTQVMGLRLRDSKKTSWR
jgi:hypothetical protein